MSIAEKLTVIAENEQKVYDAGKQAERKAHWEVVQDGGKTQNYYYAFAYGRVTDANFNPEYDIKCSNGITPGRYIFYNSPDITDTKVGVYANNNNAQYCFAESGFVTIRLFYVYETTNLTGTFQNCTALANLTIDGTIGQNIDLHWSPLTRASVESVVEHLSDASEGMTATFSEEAVLAAFGSAEAWEEYIASKPNWTFALA